MARIGSRFAVATNEVMRFGKEMFSMEVTMNLETPRVEERFKIQVGVVDNERDRFRFQVTAEELRVAGQRVYEPLSYPFRPVDPAYLQFQPFVTKEIEGGQSSLEPFRARRDQPALTQMRENNGISQAFKFVPKQVSDIFANIRFLELSPDRMREPGFPGPTMLGESGENLSVVLDDICADPTRKMILTDWLRELTPMDIEDLEFYSDPGGRVHLQIVEANGRRVSAYSASDGTLRFLAILAALLGGEAPALYFLEEIDTGIHPARLALLLELIERQTARGNVQVVTTTHAPDLLTLANDSTFENMSVVCRLEESHDAIIRPVAELPNAKELRISRGGLGRLLSEGWMETALAFTENGDDADADGDGE